MAKHKTTSKKAAYSSTSLDLTEDTKTIIVVLLLLFAYPVGLVLMWLWSKWPRWAKLLISIPLIIGLAVILMLLVGGTVAFFLFAARPRLVPTPNQPNPSMMQYSTPPGVNTPAY